MPSPTKPVPPSHLGRIRPCPANGSAKALPVPAKRWPPAVGQGLAHLPPGALYGLPTFAAANTALKAACQHRWWQTPGAFSGKYARGKASRLVRPVAPRKAAKLWAARGEGGSPRIPVGTTLGGKTWEGYTGGAPTPVPWHAGLLVPGPGQSRQKSHFGGVSTEGLANAGRFLGPRPLTRGNVPWAPPSRADPWRSWRPLGEIGAPVLTSRWGRHTGWEGPLYPPLRENRRGKSAPWRTKPREKSGSPAARQPLWRRTGPPA